MGDERDWLYRLKRDLTEDEKVVMDDVLQEMQDPAFWTTLPPDIRLYALHSFVRGSRDRITRQRRIMPSQAIKTLDAILDQIEEICTSLGFDSPEEGLPDSPFEYRKRGSGPEVS